MYKLFIFTLIVICSCKNKNVELQNSKGLILEQQFDSLSNIKQISIDTFYFDKLVKACLSTSDGQTTLGMIQCFDTATIYLDSILLNTYEILYNKLDKVDKKKLKKSQENWVKFKKAENEFLYSSYYTWANYSKYGHGREDAITQAAWKYDIVRERLINLLKYNEGIYIEESE